MFNCTVSRFIRSSYILFSNSNQCFVKNAKHICLASNYQSGKLTQICNGHVQIQTNELLSSQIFSHEGRRYKSFLQNLTANEIWKGVTSVSKAGQKRGRGSARRRVRSKNLNRGQYIGEGRVPMVWPGLNAPILRRNSVVTQEALPPNPDFMKNLIQIRDQQQSRKKFKLHPLERGWTGSGWPGRKLPPLSVDGEIKSDFVTIVLEMKTVAKMDSLVGKKRRKSLLLVTGNQKGMAGFSFSKGNVLQSLITSTQKAALKKLIHFDLFEDRTVFHDFHSRYRFCDLYVKRMPVGYGLRCHRVLTACCEAIGIKDIYAKVEGSRNTLCIVRAFFLGLLRQKTHEQLAEEKGLHVVRIENGYYPTVVASPQTGALRTQDQIPKEEELDYDLYTMEGKVRLSLPKSDPFYTKLPTWEKYLSRLSSRGHHDSVRHDLKVDRGEISSFYYPEYPECIAGSWMSNVEEEEDSV